MGKVVERHYKQVGNCTIFMRRELAAFIHLCIHFGVVLYILRHDRCYSAFISIPE